MIGVLLILSTLIGSQNIADRMPHFFAYHSCLADQVEVALASDKTERSPDDKIVADALGVCQEYRDPAVAEFIPYALGKPGAATHFAGKDKSQIDEELTAAFDDAEREHLQEKITEFRKPNAAN